MVLTAAITMEKKSDKNKDFKIALAAMISSEDFAEVEKKLNGVLVNAWVET